MHDPDETPPPPRDARGTSVPNEWGNRLARHWAAEIPRTLTGGWLRTMYALRALASADGRLRYGRSGHTITLREIATAARADVKDVRRWLTAAIAAGIVCTPEGRPAGRTVLYALLVSPSPRWAAAEAVELQGRRQGRDPVVWPTRVDDVDVDDLDTAAAVAEDIEHAAAPDAGVAATWGRGAPTPTEGHRAPAPGPTTEGHRAPRDPGAPRPEGVGAPRPHIPGDDHERHQDVVSYGTEVQTAREHEPPDGAAAPRPALAPVPDPPPGTRARGRAVPPGQPPLLMSVPGQPPPPPPVPGRVTGDQVHTVGWRSAFGLLPEARPHPETGT